MSAYRSGWLVGALLLVGHARAVPCLAEATNDEGVRACITLHIEPQGYPSDVMAMCRFRFGCVIERGDVTPGPRWNFEVERLCIVSGPVVGDVRWAGPDVVVAVVTSMPPNLRLAAWRIAGGGAARSEQLAAAAWDTGLYDFDRVDVRIVDDAVLVEATVGDARWSSRTKLESTEGSPDVAGPRR